MTWKEIFSFCYLIFGATITSSTMLLHAWGVNILILVLVFIIGIIIIRRASKLCCKYVNESIFGKDN